MKRVILQGKVWEIRHLLKKYSEQFHYVTDWIDFIENQGKNKQAKIIPFPIRK